MTVHAHPGDSLSKNQRLVYILILGALTALGPFTVDLYLPALPILQEDFAVSSSMIQLTLTATMLGFGFGQLIVGPWSDKIGRKIPLMTATLIHIAASFIVAFAGTIQLVMLGRVMQGFGAAAGGVVAMAMVRDLFSGRPLVRMLSRLALVNGLAPVIAPVLGSWLLLAMPWSGLFFVLAAYGIFVVLCVALWITETHPPQKRQQAQEITVRQRYRMVLSDRVFLGIALVGSSTFTGLFAYLSSSSFIFQGIYGFSAQQYGTLFAVNSLGVILGVQTSARLTKFFQPQWILSVTTLGMFISASLIVLFEIAGFGFWGTAIPLWFFILCMGFGFPCIQVLALNPHGKAAGTAASLLGAMNFGIAGLVSPVVGLFGVDSAVPMGMVMMIAALVAVGALWLIVRPHSVPTLLN